MSAASARPIPVPSRKCKRAAEGLAFRLLCWLALAAGCGPLVPARSPPQVQHTPGAFVVVDAGGLDAGSFRLEYPPAWKLVKSSPATAAQLQFVFVAPDGGTVTVSQVDAIDEPVEGQMQLQLDNGVALEWSIAPGPAASASFMRQAEALVASIRG